MSNTTPFTHIHREDLEVLAGRRGEAGLRAVRLHELDGLIGGGNNSVVSRLSQTTALIGNPADPAAGSVLASLATVTTAAEQAAENANQAQQDADQVSQDLTNTAQQLTNAIAQIETRIGGDFSHVNGVVPGYGVIFDDLAKLHGAPAGSALTGTPELGFDDTTTVTDQGAVRSSSGATNGDLVFPIPVTTTGALEGLQARVSILVKATTLTPATHIAFAYSAAGFGDSGILTAPVTNAWTWIDFFYGVPALSGNVDHHIGLWAGQASGSGTSFKIAAVSVQLASHALDMPDVEDLRASIREMSALDGTANTAFATMLNQLSVNANGQVAGIENFGSAMADIHGKTQSAYLLRAKAGGQAAEFEMVAWDDVDGSDAGSVIRLKADEIIATGSLSADRLVTGATANLLNDPVFAQGHAGWELDAGESSGAAHAETSIGLRLPGDSYAGASYVTFMMHQAGVETVGESVLYVGRPSGSRMNVPCQPGDWLDFSAYCYSLRCEFKADLLFLRTDGTVVSTNVVAARGTATDGGTANPDLWARIWGNAQAPAEAAFATVRLTKYGTTSGADSFLFIHKPMVSPTHEDATGPALWTPGGATLINGGNILADSIGREQLRVNSIYAEHLNSNEVKADHIEIDGTLDMDADESAIRMDKLGVSDFVNDGVYMGRHDDGSGIPAFGFNIGRSDADKEEYIRLTKQDGLVIKNANYLIGAGRVGSHSYTSTSGTHELSLAGVNTFSAQMVGGGGGGHGGSNAYETGGGNGSSGSASIIRLFDGSTLIRTWTRSGGAGATGYSSNRNGNTSSMSPYGNGGNGGVRGVTTVEEWRPGGDGGDTIAVTYYGVHGDGGRASSMSTITSYDVSGLTDPRLVITVGARGSGGSAGGHGATSGSVGNHGIVRVQTSADTFVDAAPVALRITATGSFHVSSGGGSFPDIAPNRGLWLIQRGPTSWVVSTGSGGISVHDDNTTFIANARPTWSSASSSKTVYYKFWAM